MCGICGIVQDSRSVEKEEVIRMRDELIHRGPDDAGLYVAESVGFGHQRLSIIDLTPTGHQPMFNEDGSLVLVFNGEIYNYIELRSRLTAKGHVFRSTSDSEVILHAFEEYGADCVQHFNGMFAFAIWDTKSKSLFLARDRVGIKPLYYFQNDDRILFASEIKAILAADGVERIPNESAIHEYWRESLAFSDQTWFKNVFQLLPGHWLMWQDGVTKRHQYWDISFETDETKTERQWTSELRELLEDSARLTLRSDVPVGAHLSGGLDSSTLVALACKFLSGPCRTFSGRYAEGPPFDEGTFLREVAQQLETEHYEVTITPSYFEERLSQVIWHMDQPLAGPGVISQQAVCELTKSENTKVVLSGQGGDELFCGYFDNYQPYLASLWQDGISLSHMNNSVRTMLSLLVNHSPNKLFSVLKRRRQTLRAEEVFPYEFLESHPSPLPVFPLKGGNPIERKMYWDLKYRLPALLHVEDRTSMASSIESRVPLLDYKIVEFATSIPFALKIRNGVTKYIMRKAVEDLLPQSVLKRKDKVGFTLPLAQWFASTLNPFISEILGSERFLKRGIFRPDVAGRLLAEHGHRVSRHGELWKMINIELWFRTYIDGATARTQKQMK